SPAAAASPPAAAGSPAAAAPATGEPIKVGGIFDLSGGTADVGVPYAEGVRDYVKYANERGGISGRPIQLKDIDYAYHVPKAVEAYNQLVKNDGVSIIMGWSTGDTEAMKELITRDKEPFMSASYSENLVANVNETPYNFMIGVTYSDQARIALRWIK